jgi:signal transduction histidine kinase/CheY-like chemotaxis protein
MGMVYGWTFYHHLLIYIFYYAKESSLLQQFSSWCRGGKSVKESIIESNCLLDELDQAVYVADIDTYEILYMNRTSLQRLHCNDYAGKKCYKLIQGLDAPCPFCTNAKLKKDEVYCWEHYNVMLGRTYQMQDKQIDYQGHRARLEVAFDVSDHISREYELQTVQNTQRELAAAIQILNGAGTIDERLNGALENGGEYFQADRAYIFLINKQGSLDNAYEWCRDGVKPQIGKLQGVDVHLINRWMPFFREKKAIVTPDIEKLRESMPEEYRILKDQDIYSTVEAPLYNKDQLIGFIGLDNPSPEKIENTGELFISLTYAISNAYIRAFNEQEQLERFRQTIESLFSANPESLCTFRVNLTENICQEPHGISQYIFDSLRADTVDGMIGNAANMIPIPEERTAFLNNFSRKKLLELYHDGKTDYSIDYRRKAEDGRLIWVRTFVRMLQNPESKDIEGIIYSLNVTRDKYRDRAFSIITDREYDYEALIDPKNDTIRFLNLSSRLLPKYHEKLGKPEAVFPYEDVCLFAADTFIATEDRELYLASCRVSTIREHLDKDGYYEYQVRGHYTGKPDEFMYRRLQYYYLDDSRNTILLVQSDVTNAVLRQKKENAYVEDIIDSVSAGIVTFRMPDADHLEGQFVNMRMFRILGMEEPDGPDARKILLSDPVISAYMKNAFIAVHPDDLDRVKKVFHDGYDKEYFNAGNYRILKKDGNPVWINQEAILREVRPDGRIFYASYRVVEHEVELQGKLERQLVKEKLLREEADSANSAKSEFLSRMSHDMRTPLNGIIGMTYLTREMDLPEKAKDNLQKIDISSRFLLGLINDVLDMTKAESGKIELHPEPYPVDEFADYMNSIIEPLCAERSQILSFEPKVILADVIPLMDKLRINQVVFNLLSNAVKYTPEGGKIRYRIIEKKSDDRHMTMHLEIMDNGIGMSEEFQKVLFEPFTQENRADYSEMRGTGLGLSITKRLIDAMGGTITVNSRLGEGTTFFVDFLLDCIPAQTEKAERKKGIGQEENLSGRHILLCEDHPLNQEIAKAILEEGHMIVTVADDGEAGVKTFNGSSIGYFDCILMDIHMPIMDGYESTKTIRGLRRADAKTVPIIALTADAFTDDIQKCLQAGMNGHIAKPIDPKTLNKELLKVISH